GHARRGVDRYTAGLAADDRDLPGVDAGADVNAEIGDGRLHRRCRHDRFRCAVEEGEEAVAVGPELAAAKRSITVRIRSLCSRSNRVPSASPTRSSMAVESQMSENTIVASTRAPRSSGDFPYACPLVNSTDSHGTSPSTHATCPGGISYASPGPMVRVVPSFVRTVSLPEMV